MGSELHMMEIGVYGTLFGQVAWKFLYDLSNKDAIDFNSRYIKFISLKQEAIRCPTGMRTSGKPCIIQRLQDSRFMLRSSSNKIK